MVEYNIVKYCAYCRKRFVVGKAKMYKLNIKNPVVNRFIDYYWAVVDSIVRRENKIKDEEKSLHPASVSTIPVSAKNI